MRLILKLIISLSLFIVTNNNIFASGNVDDSYDNRKLCHQANGVWRKFGNGCVDSCMPKFSKFRFCTMAITYGCDCGDDSCYYNNNCYKLQDFKKEYDIINELKKKKISEQRKLREAEYNQTRNKIISDLVKGYNIEQESEEMPKNNDDSKQEITSNSNVHNFYISRQATNNSGESKVIYYNKEPSSKNVKYSSNSANNNKDISSKSFNKIFDKSRDKIQNKSGSRNNGYNSNNEKTDIYSIIPSIFMNEAKKTIINNSKDDQNTENGQKKQIPVIPIE